MRAPASPEDSLARGAAVVPIALLVGLGLLAGAVLDGTGGGAVLPIAIADAVAGSAALLLAVAWALRWVPRRRADDAFVLLAVLAVVPNTVSVVTRHAAGGLTATTSFYLGLVPLAMGALVWSRRHYVGVAALTVAAALVQVAAVGAIDPLFAGVLVASVAAGWIVQDVIRRVARDRAAAEAARAEAAAERARAERLATLGTLVGSLSHEINSPLMVVQGNAEMARMTLDALVADATLDAPRRAAIENVARALAGIDKSAGDVNAVMRALLLLADAPPGRHADVQDVLAHALVLARIRVPTNVEVVFERGPPAPIGVDARDLFQIVLTLLADAADSCARHGGRILVSARAEAADVVVSVADDAAPRRGAGPEGALPLARAAEIARAVGGVLEVEHPPGGGTRRTLRAPAPPAAFRAAPA